MLPLARDLEDVPGWWVHPFENNVLADKLVILDEYLSDDQAWLEAAHVDVCRQIAGGC